MSALALDPIRPSYTPPTPQGAGPAGQKLQGGSALFALARAKMAEAAQAPAAAPVAATVPAPAPTAPAPVQRMSATPAEPPQTVLRPGSLLDIRV